MTFFTCLPFCFLFLAQQRVAKHFTHAGCAIHMQKTCNRKVHLFVAFTSPFASLACPNNDLMESKKEKKTCSAITQRHESANASKEKETASGTAQLSSTSKTRLIKMNSTSYDRQTRMTCLNDSSQAII
jgi:hypothetical protein